MPTPKSAAPRATPRRLAGLIWYCAWPMPCKRPNAEPPDDDRRQHDLQDREIPEAELVHNHVVVGHAAPVQQHAKEHAERDREPTGGVTGKGKIHES